MGRRHAKDVSCGGGGKSNGEIIFDALATVRTGWSWEYTEDFSLTALYESGGCISPLHDKDTSNTGSCSCFCSGWEPVKPPSPRI